MSSQKITEIETRFPNLEVGAFNGILMYSVQTRRKLGITTGRLRWHFISTATEVEIKNNNPMRVFFNTGTNTANQKMNRCAQNAPWTTSRTIMISRPIGQLQCERYMN